LFGRCKRLDERFDDVIIDGSTNGTDIREENKLIAYGDKLKQVWGYTSTLGKSLK
jgi:hypothetical protein